MDKDDMGQSSGFIAMEDLDAEAMGMVLARFEGESGL